METNNLSRKDLWNKRATDSIKELIRRMIKRTKKNELSVMEFNGITVLAHKNSIPGLLFRDQQRAQSKLITTKIIGPFPERKLSKKDKIKFTKI